ncbi:MAG: FAD binding domain-containing protein, partial [Candidatus Binatia bacterium]
VMYPSSFEYYRAESIDEALSLLSQYSDGQLLAGGHSLIPAMKLRLSEPHTLIDISRISDLKSISKDGGTVRIGALATHTEVSLSDVVRESCLALAEAAGIIGDPQVRNKGTIGGNIVHADPASDYPGILLALGATVVARSASGERSIPSQEFFTGLFETSLEEGEIVTEIHVPVIGNGTGAAYAKFPNPASRYAVVGLGAVVTVSNGSCSSCRIGVTGAADHAFRAEAAERALVGSDLGPASIDGASRKVSEGQEMLSDLAASAEYRAHLCAVMAAKAVAQATERAS